MAQRVGIWQRERERKREREREGERKRRYGRESGDMAERVLNSVYNDSLFITVTLISV